MKVTGYQEALRNSDDRQKIEKVENIDELIQDAREFHQAAGQATSAKEVTERCLARCRDMQRAAHATEEEPAQAVTLSTLHTAKGLEFDTVVLAGFDDRRLPHHCTVSETENKARARKEERRLAYVGMTRATKDLYLSTQG